MGYEISATKRNGAFVMTDELDIQEQTAVYAYEKMIYDYSHFKSLGGLIAASLYYVDVCGYSHLMKRDEILPFEDEDCIM